MNLKNETVLISAVGGDIGQSAVKSLRETGVRIVGMDCTDCPLPPGFVDSFHKIPAASEKKKYLEAVSKLIKSEKCRYFLPIAEAELDILNKNRSETDTWNVKCLINNQKTLDHCLSKLETVRYLQSLKIAVPQSQLLCEFDGSIAFPLIAKSTRSSGSRNNWEIKSERALNWIKEEDDGSFIIQEKIGSPDQEFTTAVFSDLKSTYCISFKRKLGFGGLSIEAELSDDPFLEKMGKTIAKDLSLFGSINIQSRKVGQTFFPFEINPRLSSTLLIRKKFGFDDAVWWLKAAIGEEIQYKRLYSRGKGVRALGEYFLDLKV